MEKVPVPAPLRDRLGHEATLGLIELLDSAREAWSEHVLSVAADRFERRLSEEMSKLRVEMHGGFAALRQELATARVELLKWSFLCWVGQVAAMAGPLAFMLRAASR